VGQSSTTLHEAEEKLDPGTVDRHRAVVSLMEELEAVDWYDQRVDAARDPELRAILAHNRDEEKEHASMVLEWLRRQDAKLDAELREYLFREGPIATHGDDGDDAHEAPAEPAGEAAGPGGGDGSLGIGSLRVKPARGEEGR